MATRNKGCKQATRAFELRNTEHRRMLSRDLLPKKSVMHQQRDFNYAMLLSQKITVKEISKNMVAELTLRTTRGSRKPPNIGRHQSSGWLQRKRMWHQCELQIKTYIVVFKRSFPNIHFEFLLL